MVILWVMQESLFSGSPTIMEQFPQDACGLLLIGLQEAAEGSFIGACIWIGAGFINGSSN